MSCLTITSRRPPPLTHMIDKFWEVRELINSWNLNMYKYYIPSWVCCLDESVSIWINRWTCPGWIFIPRKPHPFGNEYHTIADGLTNILFWAEIVEGKDAPNFPVPFEEKGQTSGLLLRLTRGIWQSGRVVILDSGFCVLQGIVELMKKGVYSSALIKKRKYWPKLIKGAKIDAEMVRHEIGKTASINGTLDNIKYNIFCLKEPDYVCKLMSTYGGLCPPGRERKGTARTCDDGSVVKFTYDEPWANHFDYRHCVDNHNNLRHSKPSLEETWRTFRWAIRVLAFFLGLSEVNTFLIFRYFVWTKEERLTLQQF